MEGEIVKKAEKIKNLVLKINKTIKCQVQSYLRDCGFTLPQIMLLKELRDSEQLTLTELSSRLSLANSTVSGIVDRLEAHGAVERHRDNNDRRVIWIKLSAETRKIASSIPLLQNDFFANLIGGLNNEQIEKVIEGLNIMEKLLEENAAKNGR